MAASFLAAARWLVAVSLAQVLRRPEQAAALTGADAA